jgi:enamine deaminase RidA (YjgF/YER057c/UK114 family)
MKRKLVNPPGTEALYESWKFSQAVRVGDTVWVSGQVGTGPDGIPAKIDEQARFAFENLKTVLAAAGASLGDVVELVTYHTDITEVPAVAAVKDEFISQDYPAWTVVGVTALALPDLRLEVRATAVLGSSEVDR